MSNEKNDYFEMQQNRSRLRDGENIDFEKEPVFGQTKTLPGKSSSFFARLRNKKASKQYKQVTGTNKFINKKQYHRVAGVVYVIAATIYFVWLFTNLDRSNWLISYPYLLFQTYMFALVALSVFNHWKAKYRTERPPLPADPPPVAVIIPTHGEPVDIVKETVKSILHLDYPGEVVIVLSNGLKNNERMKELTAVMSELSEYWQAVGNKSSFSRKLHLRYSDQNGQFKAGNMNNTLGFLRDHYPHIDLVLTQDADEIAYPDLLRAIIGYFEDPKIAYVQTIKQANVSKDDPFGNHDLMWYGRTAACRDSDNAMFACGSGVVWRMSAVNSVGGFNTWNLVEDLTTSYELLSAGWESRYHYEALSIGIAPEDLANFVRQRGTWAIDTMRIFFWKNPLLRRGLTVRQKLQFLETPLFYINGLMTIGLVIVTSLSLLFRRWPTVASATEHAMYLLPSFFAMEIYFLLLGGEIRYRRIRQFWAGLSPVFALAVLKALFYGPNKKPRYIVTKKENQYDNYIRLVWPQIAIVSLITLALLKTIISTPLYSAFDWAVVFWGFYQASFFIQVIKVSVFKWEPDISFVFENGLGFELVKIRELLRLRLSKISFQFSSPRLSKLMSSFLSSSN